MPNWVCNHLIIHGENAVEVMNSLLSENSESENGYDVDFNKIIPMPEDLRIESGSVTRDCAKLYVNAMLEGCDAYKKCAALYVQAFGKDIAMSEDEQIKTMEYVMLHKDYEKNCPLFQIKADAYAYGKKALDNYEKPSLPQKTPLSVNYGYNLYVVRDSMTEILPIRHRS